MGQKIPRILYLTSSWPHGPVFGGQLRALHIGRALAQLGRVTVLNVGSESGNRDAMRETAREFEVLPPIAPRTMTQRRMIEKLRWAFDTRYLNVHGVVASDDDRARLASYFDEYDLVWVLNSRTPNVLLRWDWPHSHLDLDDVPSTYERAVAANGATFRQRAKAQARHILLRRRERLFQRRFTTLSVCSEADRRYLGGGAIHVIPNGFEPPKAEPKRNLDPGSPRIGFIGLYSYPPNLDGVRWFLDQCWPAIRQSVPGVRFRLVGKGTDGECRPREPDVDALGWLADATDEIATWSAMIIPIRFGGGTRIKIAEAFSRKCPIVSTTFGAYGYEVESGQQLLLADNPESFSQRCVDLLQDSTLASGLAERGWRDFLEKWTWNAIGAKVVAAANDCLQKSRNPVRR